MVRVTLSVTGIRRSSVEIGTKCWSAAAAAVAVCHGWPARALGWGEIPGKSISLRDN